MTRPTNNGAGLPVTTENAVLGVDVAKAAANTKLEMNDVTAVTQEQQIGMIRAYCRGKILAQFGVREVKNLPEGTASGGKLYFNNVRTALKLPKPKMNADGSFSETLENYYNRVKPELKNWLAQSYQNAAITVEQINAIGE